MNYRKLFANASSTLMIYVLLGFLAQGCTDAPAVIPNCTPTASCDDGNALTENDVYDANCNCFGSPIACPGIGDEDEDGICTDIDCDDTDASNTNLDRDGDGICSNNDCDDSDAQVFIGATCDDGNSNTENDVIDEDCSCRGEAIFGNFSDPRDGQIYLTIDIGLQTWMAQNLNFNIDSSWCYDEDPINCDFYGRLYTFYSAEMACPVGWHLPSIEEWDQTFNQLGGLAGAGGAMKSTELWVSPNVGANNSSGFSALPSGCRGFNDAYNMLGISGFWWSTSRANNGNNILTPAMNTFTADILDLGGHAGDAFSIRCVKD